MQSPLIISRKTTYNQKIINFIKDNQDKDFFILSQLCQERKVIEDNIFDFISNNSYQYINLRKIMKKIKKNKLIEKVDITGIDPRLKHLIIEHNSYVQLIESKREQISKQKNELYATQSYQLKKTYANNKKLASSLKYTIGKGIEDKLEMYLSEETLIKNKRAKRLELLLTKYITRATTKTSPLADLLLTSVVREEENNNFGVICDIEPNLSIILRILESFFSNEKNLVRLSVRLNSTIVFKGEDIYVTSMINDDAGDLVGNKQGLHKFKNNTILTDIYNYFNSGEGKPVAKLIEFCRDNYGFSYDTAYQLIKRLFRSHFIILDTPGAERSVGFLSELDIFLLNNFGNSSFSEFFHELAENSGCRMVEEEITVIDKRKDNIEKIMRKLALMEEVNLDKDKSLTYIEFYSNNNSDKEIAEVNKKNFNKLLEKAQVFSLLFDPTYRSRIGLGIKFKEKFGEYYSPKNNSERASCLQFISKTLSDTKETDILIGNYDFNNDKVKTKNLNKIINQIWNEIKHNSDKTELDITKFLDRGILNNEEIYHKISNSFFIQKTDNSKYVINHIYTGFTTFLSRYTKHLEVKDYEEFSKSMFEEYIDFPYSFGFNANIHKQIIKRSMLLPGDSKNNERLSWSDVDYAVKNHDLKFIYKVTNSEIYPCYTGTLVKAMCPPIMNLFDIVSVNSGLFLDAGKMYLMYNTTYKSTSMNSIQHIPQIKISDNENTLVLSREKWVIPTSIIMNLNKRELGNEEIFNFFILNNIPREFFFSVFSYDDPGKNLTEKPNYCVLTSPLLFLVLLNSARTSEYIILEKADPTVKEEGYVQEIVLENTIRG